ncbi:2Fe-2S iron-sulfur cluster-binding protein [Methylibium petroleiphilum]
MSVDPCPSSHRVTIADTGEAYSCNSAETVLVGLARLGKRGIPVGCRGGGCGVCKVEVVSGQYRKRVMSRTHVNADDEACHRVLACCIYPNSDLVVRAIGAMQKSLNRGSNAAASTTTPEAAKA